MMMHQNRNLSSGLVKELVNLGVDVSHLIPPTCREKKSSGRCDGGELLGGGVLVVCSGPIRCHPTPVRVGAWPADLAAPERQARAAPDWCGWRALCRTRLVRALGR